MIFTVIMAGGKGTRFWPLSREIKAKQFLKLSNNNSLIENTISRMTGLSKPEEILVVSNKNQTKYLKKIEALIPQKNILKEPIGKNTLPCIAWAAIECLKKANDPIMVILPSDHHISPVKTFHSTINEAIKEVQENNTLVTLGIKPTHAHTGYGYIQVDDNHKKIRKVKAFKEKPNKNIANQYLKKGNYFWNAGIFIWKASKIIELIETYYPTLSPLLEELRKTPASHTKQLRSIFEAFPTISIDYGILEHEAQNMRLIPANFKWNDIGNWSALQQFLKLDNQDNAYKTDFIQLNSKNNIAYSEKKLIACIDVDNLVIVDSDDALLILPKSSDQKIKELYDKLPKKFK